jgi:hypothetical protein
VNSILKALIAAGIVATFNFNVMAEGTVSAVPSLSNKTDLTHEEKEATSGVPTLLDEVVRLKQLNPKQLAEEQKALHEAMQKLTPQQLDEQREGMLKELNSMSPEERQALHDQAQTEEEKLQARERIEHSADPQHEAAANKPKKSETQGKASSAKARPANKRKARNLSPIP